MRRKMVIAGLAGAFAGIALWTIFHATIPYLVRLPGGGKRCSECHDLHGGIRFADLKTDGWIHVVGDVPREAWIETGKLFDSHQIDGLPGIRLLDLLAEHGCREFRRLILVSADGGHVELEAEYVTASTLLLPYLGAPRLADEHLHSSAWLRAIVEMCVVSEEPTLAVNGRSTTYGALLAGDRVRVVTEPGRATQRDEQTGRAYRNVTSRLVSGVAVDRLLEATCTQVTITAAGQKRVYPAAMLRDAVITRDKHEGHVVLVLPRENRDEWPVDITALDCP